MATTPPVFDVVFVCTGNRARSPLAEALLRRRMPDERLRVTSRGTLDLGPVPALPEAIRAADALGLDLRPHRARPIAPGELSSVDLVIGFEPSHVATAVVDGDAARDACFTLPELLSLAPAGAVLQGASVTSIVRAASANRSPEEILRAASIDDPFGASQATFDRLAVEIESMVDQLARLLFQDTAGRSSGSA